MSFLTHLECSNCGKHHSANQIQGICIECGNPLLPRYDLEAINHSIDVKALTKRKPTMWRYWEFLPIKNKSNIVSLGEGFTPLIRAKRLGKRIGLRNLWIKDEALIPTGTFKARGFTAAVSKAKELGVRSIALPSAGNAAGALAAYGARGGMKVYVFMPEDAPLSNKLESYICGAHVYLVKGLISQAGKIVAEGSKTQGWFNMATFKEPYRDEGKKTMGLEIAEQFEWTLPDVIIYPTGGGTGLVGMWKAFEELEEMGWVSPKKPRMISVQAKGCAPIVKAFQEGKERTEFWEEASTIAAGLRVPKSLADFLVLRALRESKGHALAVSDAEILESVKEMAREEGIFPCPEGAATLAGVKNLLNQGLVDPDEKIVLFNTGSGLKYLELFPLDLPILNPREEIDFKKLQ